ncbi:hypothetical protein NCU16777 [Neurospora crassa OR74A]|uniref:Uncharacterized protein n=1 Tax=Neurospora crassa (strain ATCC 24698 / 74-OR23-1A / CBS 708.71 / DSM 1257 / FGSC 987) TaxID=367110 RepID=V5IPZ5_NEUCR|nr:hypothetical protein NCU16777 [Neurospora crassa OR74A]ESA42841.1 hypothetical protein NCU16777 [Neurospora crassa OR74A]|eukprot:XP_011394385.1 hypothetical protein NCU16777 [Neurospora crassa OR74A]
MRRPFLWRPPLRFEILAPSAKEVLANYLPSCAIHRGPSCIKYEISFSLPVKYPRGFQPSQAQFYSVYLPTSQAAETSGWRVDGFPGGPHVKTRAYYLYCVHTYLTS